MSEQCDAYMCTADAESVATPDNSYNRRFCPKHFEDDKIALDEGALFWDGQVWTFVDGNWQWLAARGVLKDIAPGVPSEELIRSLYEE